MNDIKIAVIVFLVVVVLLAMVAGKFTDDSDGFGGGCT